MHVWKWIYTKTNATLSQCCDMKAHVLNGDYTLSCQNVNVIHKKAVANVDLNIFHNTIACGSLEPKAIIIRCTCCACSHRTGGRTSKGLSAWDGHGECRLGTGLSEGGGEEDLVSNTRRPRVQCGHIPRACSVAN